MIDLLRPLMHHKPMQMLNETEYHHFLVNDAQTSTQHRDVASNCLGHLYSKNELDLRLLDLMTAWHPLSAAQREEMLAFFERSMLLCRISQRADVMLVSARTRSVTGLYSDVASVVSKASHVALYLLPISHIGIIPQMISRALSKKLTGGSQVVTRSGADTLLVHRQHAAGPCCSVHLFPYSDLLASPVPDAAALDEQVSEVSGGFFSCVLCVASSDYGLFKFTVKCADDTMDSCSFGARFESWALRLGPSRQWVQFRHKDTLDAEASDELSLTEALGKNIHETVGGTSNLVQVSLNFLSCVELLVSASFYPTLHRSQNGGLLCAAKPHLY